MTEEVDLKERIPTYEEHIRGDPSSAIDRNGIVSALQVRKKNILWYLFINCLIITDLHEYSHFADLYQTLLFAFLVM